MFPSKKLSRRQKKIRLRRHFFQQRQFVDQSEIPTHEGLGLANQTTSCRERNAINSQF